jgi:hypothetical protein
MCGRHGESKINYAGDIPALGAREQNNLGSDHEAHRCQWPLCMCGEISPKMAEGPLEMTSNSIIGSAFYLLFHWPDGYRKSGRKAIPDQYLWSL